MPGITLKKMKLNQHVSPFSIADDVRSYVEGVGGELRARVPKAVVYALVTAAKVGGPLPLLARTCPKAL